MFYFWGFFVGRVLSLGMGIGFVGFVGFMGFFYLGFVGCFNFDF